MRGGKSDWVAESAKESKIGSRCGANNKPREHVSITDVDMVDGEISQR